MKIKNMYALAFMFIFVMLSISFISATTDSVDVDDYSIEYEYNSAEAGKRFSLDISITNLDDDPKENVTFEFDFEDPFDEVGSDSWDIGTIGADETVTKSFRIEIDDDAESRKESIEFTIEDDDDDYDDEIEIKVTTDSAEIDYVELESFPSRISANQDDIKFVVTLENEGDEEIEKAKAKLILPTGFTFSESYSNIDNLGEIRPSEEVKAEFYFDTDKNLLSKEYTAQLEIEYEEDGDEEVKTLEFVIPVKPTPQFSIVEVKTEGQVFAGQESTVKIKLQNFGEEEGKETSIKVFEKSEHPFEFVEKSSSVGLVKPNEEGNAVLKFSTDKDATPGEYIIDFQIRTINSGDVLVFEDSFKVNVYKKESSPIGLIVMGLIAISVFSGVFVYQKKKQK